MDAATIVLGCLLSHPGQSFAFGIGLVPEVGEEDEEDGPINPDKVDEDRKLVLAAGHEVVLGDVDRDDHKLCQLDGCDVFFPPQVLLEGRSCC